MGDKCKKVKGGKLERCESMQLAISHGLVSLRSLLNMETRKQREEIALVKKKGKLPLDYCPWCRANIDTYPKEPAA